MMIAFQDTAMLIRNVGLLSTCRYCRRECEKVKPMCSECFSQWYDADNSTIDKTDPVSIGNYVRKKHGLPPLEAGNQGEKK